MIHLHNDRSGHRVDWREVPDLRPSREAVEFWVRFFKLDELRDRMAGAALPLRFGKGAR